MGSTSSSSSYSSAARAARGRRGGLAALVLLLIVAACEAGGRESAQPSGLIGIARRLEILTGVSELTLNYYDIHGTSSGELRAEMARKGPIDLSKERRDGFFEWRIDWSWPDGPDGKPSFERTEARGRYKLTLPRWEPPASASTELITEWERFLVAMLDHERVHLDNALSHRAEIERVIREAARANPGINREQADSLGQKLLKRLRERDIDFDLESDHGRKTGVILR